ncbi:MULTISPECIES: hypothetical protein [unclassified Serratia (in: enterobacteria)]|uniref:hypothetical protein n=1 Tax=unclassified Serratia (in: enterobacteria) TaxID=2647522 RepID=UPI0012690BB3|nr:MULTISPECIES: hypothetical protein [unclassified Serratia (in: enterobacteria)]
MQTVGEVFSKLTVQVGASVPPTITLASEKLIFFTTLSLYKIETKKQAFPPLYIVVFHAHYKGTESYAFIKAQNNNPTLYRLALG